MGDKGKYLYGRSLISTHYVAAIATASTVGEVPVFVAPYRCKVIGASILTQSAITGADTNYCTLGFKNKGQAGTGTDVVASKAFTNGIDTVAFDDTNLGALTFNNLLKGDTVTFYKAVTGDGLAMPQLAAVLKYVRA